jgi:hypothetical protein
VSSEIFDPLQKVFWYRYGFSKQVPENYDTSHFGNNANSWSDWLPFFLEKMHEEGAYTNWDGTLTSRGSIYSQRLKNILR